MAADADENQEGTGMTAGETTQTKIDLYKEVHKGLRRAIFGITEAAGSADGADETATQAVADEVVHVVGLLRAHAGHEDAVLQPLVDQHAPDLLDELMGDHEESEAELDALEELASSLGGRDEAGRREGLADLYRLLRAFCVSYLSHLEFEETKVMPALASALTADQLLATRGAVLGRIPPDEMRAFLLYMLPAMNLDERTLMLGGMKAMAPPEVFGFFSGVAQEALGADGWQAVEDRIGSAAR